MENTIIKNKLTDGFLTGNALKLIAIVLMTVDHIGYILFPISVVHPEYVTFRIIGRLAFPIFAFLIAEGCRYTKKPVKYILTMFIAGIVAQIGYTIGYGSFFKEQSIFTTLLLSMLILIPFRKGKETGKKYWFLLSLSAIGLSAFVCYGINYFFDYDIHIDYGFFGTLLPCFAFFCMDKKILRLLIFSAGLFILSLNYTSIQLYCLLATVILFFYNGKRGTLRIKYLFYTYYPAHLGILWLIREFVMNA